ncbi:MAG: PDC sensor domain-containing protein, partial [Thiolinea sp.]
MPNTLKHSINAHRVLLSEFLADALHGVTDDLPDILHDPEALDERLSEIFHHLGQCKYVYVLDNQGVQLSSNMTRYGPDEEARGRDRSTRPYMQHMHDERIDCNLSQAYISRNKKRPSVTAVKTIRNRVGQRVGFLGVDFDLRELPHSEVMYEEPSQWRQIKGDPAIRQGLFHQERVESLMDRDIDNVLSVHEALMLDQGVHHIQIHFSSSRSTIWHSDDPYVYRLLTMDELADPNVCMAYPRRPYFERAIVPP